MNLTINTAVRWFTLNLAIPTAFTLAGITAGAIYQSAEVEPVSYYVVTENWTKLTPATRQHIADVLAQHGKLRKWDYYPKIFDAVLDDTHGYVVPELKTDTAAARQQLIQTIRDTPGTKRSSLQAM